MRFVLGLCLGGKVPQGLFRRGGGRPDRPFRADERLCPVFHRLRRDWEFPPCSCFGLLHGGIGQNQRDTGRHAVPESDHRLSQFIARAPSPCGKIINLSQNGLMPLRIATGAPKGLVVVNIYEAGPFEGRLEQWPVLAVSGRAGSAPGRDRARSRAGAAPALHASSMKR